MDLDDLDEIETIADGVVDRTGAFVRTTWLWSEMAPRHLLVSARINGQTQEEMVDMADFLLWLGDAHHHATVWVNGERIVIPTNYLSLLSQQIAWMQTDRTEPIPGGQRWTSSN